MRRFFGLGLAVALAVAACGGAPPPTPATTVTLPPASASSSPVAPSAASSSPMPSTPPTPPAPSAKPKICGCSLCEPAVSEDACSTDADCAPSTPCHAEQCVAKGKAIPRKPGEMCTMLMSCASADANSCGCLKGKCALSPRKP